MRWISRRTRTPIGVDVGRRYTKAAQLSRAENRWRLEAASAFPRGQSGPAIDRRGVRQLREVLYRQGFTGRTVVLAVPRENLLISVLELPPRSSGAPVDQIARMELAGIHKCQPDSFEMACWDLPAAARARRTTQAMVAACPHADAEPLLDAFEQEGLDVQALDIDSCALSRACKPLMPAPGGIAALLDLGWESAQLGLFHQGVAVYKRTLAELGVRSLCEALSEQLGLEVDTIDSLLGEVGACPAGRSRAERGPLDELGGGLAAHLDSMAKELEASFSYAVHLYPEARVERLLLAGGGASAPAAAEHLGSVLGVEAKPVAPEDLADCPAPLAAESGNPALTMAVGLAQFAEEQRHDDG